MAMTGDTPAGPGRNDYIPALSFRWLTRFYDALIGLGMPERRMRGRLVDALAPAPGEAILEFGCGTASNLVALKQRQPDLLLTGIDVDPEILEIARAKLDGAGIEAELVHYSGAELPFEDVSLDGVCTLLVFHHLTLEQKKLALAEIRRVLKPGGRFVLADWGRQRNPLLRAGFFLVQLLDGFETTRSNARGLVPGLVRQAGFQGLQEAAHMITPLGRITYWSARK
jgi:ubiquinone/menaquinone biosynthesis C-methylase UbiE